MKRRMTIIPVDRKVTKAPPVYERIRCILESARTTVARTVNATQVVAYWLIGQEIVEEEQKGRKRAGYGKALIGELSDYLTRDFGRGWSVRQLAYVRSFYLEYGCLLNASKSNAVRSISGAFGILHAVRAKSSAETQDAMRGGAAPQYLASGSEIHHAVRGESWKPGLLHPNLSWTHYRTLLRVDKPEARAFYEIEAIKNNWSARELERQICSLLYVRLALSRDKKGLILCAEKNDAVVRYTLGEDQQKKIFASRYKLYLPTEAELRAEIRRGVRAMRASSRGET